MRTTITIDELLLTRLKQEARERGTSVSRVITDAVRVSLAIRKDGKRSRRFRLVTFRGTGPRPGVDLDRSSELLELDESKHLRRRRRWVAGVGTCRRS